jgi:hypothetical protein
MAGRKQKFAKEAQALAVMAKAGRKAQIGIREPSGRLSRSARKLLGADSVNEIRRVREAALAGMRDPLWGTQLGRLFLEGKISGEQFRAGRNWAELMEKWRAIHCGPRFNPKPGLSNLFRVGGGGASVGDIIADPHEATITALVDEVIESFSRGAADPLLIAVRECVELDLAPVGVGGWMLLDEGLAHLADWWKVEG